MEKPKALTALLPPPLVKRFKKAVQDQGLKMAYAVRQALELWLETIGK
jgi:hypothetical protein